MNHDFLLGRRLSPGLTSGPAWVVNSHQDSPLNYKQEASSREKEKFTQSLIQVDQELERIEEKSKLESTEQAEIMAAHRMLLQDPEWQEGILLQIEKNNLSAPEAVRKTTSEFAQMMASLDDAYLRERAHDIEDVGQRVVRNLSGEKSPVLLPEQGQYILVAQDMTPSQFASLDKKRVLGLIMEQGGVTSHIAIMTRIYEIPALSGIENATQRIHNEDWLFLHADKSQLYINPTSEQKQSFLQNVEAYKKSKEELYALKGKEAKTLDGTSLHLEANIGHETDLQLVQKYGASGIGLFRTEFLFFDRAQAPSEEEQYQIYLKTAQAVKPHPVVIRTFDIGADKLVPYIEWPKEDNPFLGLRALRYCLKKPKLFQTQLRALLRASCEAPLSIMFPMVSSLDELKEARAHLDLCEKEIRAKGGSPQYKLGIMIEVPSAALIANQLAQEVDFFSIGTNDLIQYVCAVDRMNEEVAHLYQSFHPGVLNLISQVIAAGKKHNLEVAMCGEMAADLELIPLLIGMGLRTFSQSPSTVLRSKKLILGLKAEKCEKLWNQVKDMGSAVDIQKACKEFAATTID